MTFTVADRPPQAHRERAESPDVRMAKMNLRYPEPSASGDLRWLVGQALKRAFSLLGWSLKEAAAKVGRDERQVARWLNGAERPQLDALFAVEELRQPVVQALSELVGAEVEVTIRLRRTS